MKFRRMVILWLSLLLVSGCVTEREALQPNIVLIVADDLGFSDLGVFGSEIRTPSLDALAERGLKLTNFHTAPTCGPTRAMLMTGIDPHLVGMGANAAAVRRIEALKGRRGYEGRLNEDVVTVATLLGDAGYQTYMTGKWDLGSVSGSLPVDRGFQKSFALANGGASHFSDARGSTWNQTIAHYFENADAVTSLPDDFYSSRYYTRRAVEYIQSGDPGKPFFAYVAYTAPHWPLQVPDDWLDKYRGRYDSGWQVLRTERLARQQTLGLFENAPMAEPLPGVADWSSLPDDEREIRAREMEIYAAMVEYMDWQIGELLASVESRRGDRPTLVIFVSDNGPEGNAIDRIGKNGEWVEKTFNNDLDNMGRQGSYLWTGPGWAQASATPLNLYKSFVAEGGIRTPAIMSYSGASIHGEVSNAFLTASDIPATILDAAGVIHPGTRYADREILAMEGRSALPVLMAADTVHAGEAIGWELYGNRALVRDQWKAILLWPPAGDGEWRLYDIDNDPHERVNLSEQHPEILSQLIDAWRQYSEDKGVYLFETDNGYGRF